MIRGDIKMKTIYYFIMIISLTLFIIAITLLNNTKLLAPIVIVISIYLFLGALIKLCKTNNKLKNTFICILDLLFWLP